jgi:hypothetical protein
MDHSTMIHLMDRAGRFVNLNSLQTDEKIAVEWLQLLAAM